MKKFEYSFGTFQLIQFPEVATKFTDFPDGRIIVGYPIGKSNETELLPQIQREERLIDALMKGELVHFKLNVKAPGERRDVKPDDAYQQIKKDVEEHIAELYKESGKKVIGGLKSIHKSLMFQFNPSAVMNTRGTVQLIHGVASPDSAEGTVNFELYFPRGIRFTMRGAAKRNGSFIHRMAGFTGTVMFAKKEYRFTLRGNDYYWNNYNKPLETEEEMRAFLNSLWRIHGAMSTDAAAKEMRANIYRLYPFIEEYEMLGEFRFDPVFDIEALITQWKLDHARHASVTNAINNRIDQ